MYCIYEIDAVCSPEHCEAIFMRGVPEMYCIYEIDAVCSPEHCEAIFMRGVPAALQN